VSIEIEAQPDEWFECENANCVIFDFTIDCHNHFIDHFGRDCVCYDSRIKKATKNKHEISNTTFEQNSIPHNVLLFILQFIIITSIGSTIIYNIFLQL